MKKIIISIFLLLALFSYGMIWYHDGQIVKYRTDSQKAETYANAFEKNSDVITHEMQQKLSIRQTLSAHFQNIQRKYIAFNIRKLTNKQRNEKAKLDNDNRQLIAEHDRLSKEIEMLKLQKEEALKKFNESLQKQQDAAKEANKNENTKKKFNIIAIIGTVGTLAGSLSKIFEVLGKLWAWIRKKVGSKK